MKHNSSNRRSRSRGNKQRNSGGRNNYESNGPGGKVRGTVQQVLDKYLALARDAQSSGDRIGAESYFQFAEHYFRVLSVESNNGQARRDRTAAPSDMGADMLEGNALEPHPEDTQSPIREQSDEDDAFSTEPEGSPKPEVDSDVTEKISGDIQDTNNADTNGATDPKLVRRRRAKTKAPADEIEIPKAS